jgi:uncharacterized protein (DUF1501 family)
MSHWKRRDLLKSTLCATAASGAFASMLPKLALAGGAAGPMLRGAGDDYRALVCVYLYGGYDCYSAVVPIDGPYRTQYEASRRGTGTGAGGGQQNPSDLRIASASLLPLVRNGTPLAQNGSNYGLHPQMTGLRDLVNAGRAAIVANVGPMVRPLNLADYTGNLVPVPAQLFSHSDQTVLWQTPRADTGQRLGWGGRLADIFSASNTNPLLSMNVSLSGENVFQAGQTVLPYFLNENGAERVGVIDTANGQTWNQARRNTFNAIMNASYAHPFERAYASKVRNAIAVTEQLAATLRNDRTVNPQGTETGYNDDAYAPFWQAFGLTWQRLDQGRPALPRLAAQLLMVARMIRQRVPLAMSRQLFFASLGGFDTHDTQNAALPPLLRELSQSIKGFHDVMNSPAFALADKVTLFTASEFGRTLSNNGDGTDHGWGGQHFVVGNAVNGGQFFGRLPNLSLTGNPENAGWGQIIPTLAVDQYAATLARWYGLSDTDRATIFPNLQFMTGPKLAIEGPDLGFMQQV